MTATRTATRPVRTRPAAAPARPRPALRVVRGGEPSAARLQRRRRVAVVTGGLVVCVALLGVVAAHVVLSQNQFRLEQLDRRAAEAQARYDQLRLQVAELESPERIVAAAQERLGMVAPEDVTYLTPDESVVPKTEQRARAARDGDVPASVATASGWTVVKPHLAARR